MHTRTKRLVILAALVAIQVVLSRFLSFNAWNVKLGFGFLPVALSGALYGPLAAAIVGGVSDVLGAVLFPSGPFFPGFTLTSVLAGLLYGLLLHKKATLLRVAFAAAVSQFVLGLLLNTLWISLLYHSPYIPLLVTSRLYQCAVMFPVELLVLWAMLPAIRLVERRGLA